MDGTRLLVGGSQQSQSITPDRCLSNEQQFLGLSSSSFTVVANPSALCGGIFCLFSNRVGGGGFLLITIVLGTADMPYDCSTSSHPNKYLPDKLGAKYTDSYLETARVVVRKLNLAAFEISCVSKNPTFESKLVLLNLVI